MAVMAPRESWTDNRLDEGFREIRTETASLRGEVGELRAELAHVREELGELRAEIKGVKETMDAKFDAVDKRFDDVIRTMQIGFGLMGTMFVAVIGLIGTQL